MPARFETVDRETPMLLPPSLGIDAVEQLDVRRARVNERGSGSKQYPPATMLALLAYSYATGTFASRRIEQASRQNAVSCEHSGEQLRLVELEIEQPLAKAEAADSTPLQDALTIEGELARRQERKAALAKARAEMEARAYAKAQAERTRKHPEQEGPTLPTPPGPKDQHNSTDPENRIMPPRRPRPL